MGIQLIAELCRSSTTRVGLGGYLGHSSFSASDASSGIDNGTGELFFCHGLGQLTFEPEGHTLYKVVESAMTPRGIPRFYEKLYVRINKTGQFLQYAFCNADDRRRRWYLHLKNISAAHNALGDMPFDKAPNGRAYDVFYTNPMLSVITSVYNHQARSGNGMSGKHQSLLDSYTYMVSQNELSNIWSPGWMSTESAQDNIRAVGRYLSSEGLLGLPAIYTESLELVAPINIPSGVYNSLTAPGSKDIGWMSRTHETPIIDTATPRPLELGASQGKTILLGELTDQEYPEFLIGHLTELAATDFSATFMYDLSNTCSRTSDLRYVNRYRWNGSDASETADILLIQKTVASLITTAFLTPTCHEYTASAQAAWSRDHSLIVRVQKTYLEEVLIEVFDINYAYMFGIYIDLAEAMLFNSSLVVE